MCVYKKATSLAHTLFVAINGRNSGIQEGAY